MKLIFSIFVNVIKNLQMRSPKTKDTCCHGMALTRNLYMLDYSCVGLGFVSTFLKMEKPKKNHQLFFNLIFDFSTLFLDS
jgi:hypothetical protein